MPVRYWIDEGILHYAAEGAVTFDDWRQAIAEATNDPDRAIGMPILIEDRGAEQILSTRDLQEAARMGRSWLRPHNKLAVVTSDKGQRFVANLVSTVFAGYGRPLQVETFDTAARARSWLRED